MPKKSKNKKIDVTLSEARTTIEAMNYIWIGMSYFLRNHTKKTIFALLIFFGSSLYIVYDYVLPPKVKVEEARPLNQPSASSNIRFELMPKLYADVLMGGEPIIIDGQLWGYEDTNYIVKKLAGSNELFVYNKTTKRAVILKPDIKL